MNELIQLIPHKKPFLFIDEVTSVSDVDIFTQVTFSTSEHAFYAGHYPHQAITPGVILCEAVFQSAAILIAYKHISSSHEQNKPHIPVLARIDEARFKQIVYPGETLVIHAHYIEQVSKFVLMSGEIKKLDGSTVLKIKFTLTEHENT